MNVFIFEKFLKYRIFKLSLHEQKDYKLTCL